MIHYVTGDAARPIGDGPKVIAHVCNDEGGWGSGFVLALSRLYLGPEEAYRRWARECRPLNLPLGQVQFVEFCKDVHVANMIAQRGFSYGREGIPLQYDALEVCLGEVVRAARKNGWSVHGPRFGAGLAGGDWSAIERIINKAGLDITIYDLPARSP